MTSHWILWQVFLVPLCASLGIAVSYACEYNIMRRLEYSTVSGNAWIENCRKTFAERQEKPLAVTSQTDADDEPQSEDMESVNL